MAYLGNFEHVCEKCGGKRFNDKVLSYKYRGKDISEIFNLSVKDAKEIFYDNFKISLVLNSLMKSNLSYIKLGQTLDTYSGGELQRLKIAQMLTKKIEESLS